MAHIRDVADIDDDRVTVTVAGEEYRVYPATADLIERIINDDQN